MGAVQNRSLVDRLVDEVFNKGNVAAIDEFATPNFIDHRALPGMSSGREGFCEFVSGLRAAFPDLQYSTEDTIADGDKVAQRYTVRGTMTGDLLGMPASGKVARWQETHFFRFAGWEGKAVEHWAVVDRYSMLAQLGFVEPRPMGMGG